MVPRVWRCLCVRFGCRQAAGRSSFVCCWRERCSRPRSSSAWDSLRPERTRRAGAACSGNQRAAPRLRLHLRRSAVTGDAHSQRDRGRRHGDDVRLRRPRPVLAHRAALGHSPMTAMATRSLTAAHARRRRTTRATTSLVPRWCPGVTISDRYGGGKQTERTTVGPATMTYNPLGVALVSEGATKGFYTRDNVGELVS